MINTGRLCVVLGFMFVAGVPISPLARADDNAQNLASDDEKSRKLPSEEKEETAESQNWLFHLQGTEILQGQPGFHDPYSGINSLHSGDNFRQTTTADLFFGARLLPGTEVYFNPEYYQGFSFGITHGIAAFPNAQSSKVGKYRGDVFIPHLFLRQVWALVENRSKSKAASSSLQRSKIFPASRLPLGEC